MHVLFPTAVGERVLCICELVRFTELLTFQLQFKVGSDLDEKLSKKTEVIKQIVCDSVDEKSLFEKTMICALTCAKSPVLLAKSYFGIESPDPPAPAIGDRHSVGCKGWSCILQSSCSCFILVNAFCLSQFPWRLWLTGLFFAMLTKIATAVQVGLSQFMPLLLLLLYYHQSKILG